MLDGDVLKDGSPEATTDDTKVEETIVETKVDDGPQPQATPEPKWIGQLPDELKGDQRLHQYNSIGEAFKALLDGEPSTEEYELPKTITQEIDPSGIIDKNIEQVAKDLKLTKVEAEKVYKAMADSYKGSAEYLKKNGGAICETQLKERWGENYDSKMAHMKRAYDQIVVKGSELEKGLQDTMAENNPFVVELIATMGEAIAEHQPPQSTAAAEIKRQGGFLTRENEKLPWE